jgi:hypothetical protein
MGDNWCNWWGTELYIKPFLKSGALEGEKPLAIVKEKECFPKI